MTWDKDRLWWLWIAVPIACLAGIIALTAAVLPPLGGTDAFGPPTLSGIQVGCYVLILCIVALAAPAQASQARARTRGRAAALSGESEAIPRANIPTDATQAPDVTSVPLVLMWRPTRTGRIFFGIVGLLFGPLALAGIGFLAFLYYDSFQPQDLVTAFDLSSFVAIAVPALILLVYGVVAMTIAIPTWCWVRGRPFGIIASGAGVRMRALSGGVRFMAWQEMRLFEVTREQNAPRNRLTYQLRGGRQCIQWTHRVQGMLKPDDTTPAEMDARSRALLDLIAARTGLVPRTFDKALQPGVRAFTPPPLSRRSTRSIFIGWLSLIVLWVFVAGAIRYLPLTTSLAWNLVLAVVPLLALLGAAIRNIASSRPDPLAPEMLARLSSAPPPSTAPDTVFALAYAPSRRKRLARALRAAPFAFEGVSVLILLLAGMPLDLPLDLPRLPNAAAIVLAVLLEVCVGLPGQWLWIGAVRAHPRVVAADFTGLRTVDGKRKTTIPWPRVGEIAAHERRGHITGYSVRAHGESFDEMLRIIHWPARSAPMRLLEPPAQMDAIMPDDLAALVAQRSGKKIRVL